MRDGIPFHCPVDAPTLARGRGSREGRKSHRDKVVELPWTLAAGVMPYQADRGLKDTEECSDAVTMGSCRL